MVSEELVWLSGWGWEGQAVKEDRVLGRTPSTTGGGAGRVGEMPRWRAFLVCQI